MQLYGHKSILDGMSTKVIKIIRVRRFMEHNKSAYKTTNNP